MGGPDIEQVQEKNKVETIKKPNTTAIELTAK